MFMEALPLISTISRLFKLQLEVLPLLTILQGFPDQEREGDKFLPVWFKEGRGACSNHKLLSSPHSYC